MEKKRLDWIDISKGFGILLVVFAHTLVPTLRENTSVNFLWIFIYNFHMPLFFFLSGLLFERGLPSYTKGKFILGKLKLLMIPYLTFSVFAYVFINFALKIDAFASILGSGGYTAVGIKDAVVQILTYNSHTDQHLWFVYSLFLVFLINILIPKIMKSKPVLILLLALYISKAFVSHFGILNYIASDLFFFSLARVMFRKDKSFPVENSIVKLIVFATVFITTNCIYSYFYTHTMPSGFAKAILYLIRCICSVSGIFTVCTVCTYIQNTKISKPLKTAGMYSYDIYLLHAPFLVSGSMGILLAYSPIPAVICCLLSLAVGVLLPYVLSKFVIRKVPLFSLLILGKNYTKRKYSAAKSLDSEV